MKQTQGSNNGADALQHQDDQHLTHESPPRNWIIRNWKTVASVGGLFTAAGVGVALLDWASRAIDDVGVALNFFAQNIFSMFILLAVIVQAVISNRQWRAMKDSVERTDTIIENMQGQLTSMVHQEEAMQGQLIVMNAQEAAMRDALEETRRTVRYSEAAYIAIKDGLLIQFGPNQTTVAKMFYTNAGNTPAYNVRIYGHMNLWERALVPTEHDKLKEGFGGVEISQDLIAPNGERTHTLKSRGALTDQLFQEIQAGRLRFYVWGIITYEDIFNRQRWTTFCSMQIGGGMALFGCGSNNDAEREENPN
jgi:hypothetical protein